MSQPKKCEHEAWRQDFGKNFSENIGTRYQHICGRCFSYIHHKKGKYVKICPSGPMIQTRKDLEKYGFTKRL